MLRKLGVALFCILLFGLTALISNVEPVVAARLPLASSNQCPDLSHNSPAPFDYPPLPHGSGGPGLPNDNLFVSGYVFVDGQPVAGAQVTLTSGSYVTTVQTAAPNVGGFSPCPYFYISLTLSGSGVQVSDPLTLTASYGGQSHTIVTLAQLYGQRMDIAINGRLTHGVRLIGGENHTCAATNIGTVKCWGKNDAGQLGNGTFAISQTTPVEISAFNGMIGGLAAGEAHTCALVDGKAQCWGHNYYGQLGDGTNTTHEAPVKVIDLGGNVKDITAGNIQTCALTKDSAVRCWGDNGQFQSTTPVTVTGLTSGISSIEAGYVHTCALTDRGNVKCWGANNAGQLGNGSIGPSAYLPVDVGITETVISVAAGAYHTCALINPGGVKCWGSNQYHGQLGDGTTQDHATPKSVINLNSSVKAITAGSYHTCALMIAGDVKCWGDNQVGQLGDGTNEIRTRPVNVVGLNSGVKAITAGYNHTCAILENDDVKCWGDNDYGQVGDGTTISRTTPVDVIEPFQKPLIDVAPITTPWTLLIYAAGDNNLSVYFTEMITRLQAAGPQANVQVGVLFDRNDNAGSKYYLFTPAGERKEWSVGELHMDDQKTLYDFLLWGFKQLPAQHYYLALADHANGVEGIAWDQTSGKRESARLTPREVRTALEQASLVGGHKLDVLHFDGCSFGLFEDTSLAAGYADYVIASPNTTWGIFAYSDYRRLAGEQNQPRAFAQAVAQEYEAHVGQLPYTISVFDMAKYSDVETALDQLGNSLAAYVKADSITHSTNISTTRNAASVQKYDSDDYLITQDDQFVDIRGLATTLKNLNVPTITVAAGAVLSATDQFIVDKRYSSGQFVYQGITMTVNLANAQGLAIYYPQSRNPSDTIYSQYTDIDHNYRLFSNLPQDWGWTTFINSLPAGMPARSRLIDPLPLQFSPPPAESKVFLPLVVR